MKILDIIRRKKDESKILNSLYSDAIQSRVPEIVKIFEESGSTQKEMILSSSSFVECSRKTSDKFVGFMTEKRVVTPKIYKGMSIIKSPYAYARIDSFYSRESYFSRSLNRQVETMMRNGYEFISDDPDFLKVMKQELARIHMDSGMPTNQLIFSIALSLLKYGMVIVHKVRERAKDDIAIDDKSSKKITKLRIIKPHDVLFYVSRRGKILGIQEIRITPLNQDYQKQFGTGGYGIPVEDLAIGYMYEPGDDLFPEPPCKQILDDIITLRSFEETVELLGFQFGSPLIHAQVGTDESPASAAEISAVNSALGSMASNGLVVTDHRVKIDVINLQSSAIDLTPYIEYFKNRVLIGSGSSPISVGEGNSANRNTAESLDNALADRCTYLSGIVCSLFNYNILPDILVKSETPYDYKSIFNEFGELNGYMEFNEPTLEKKISRENSVINLWEGNLITLPEARKILKRPPMSEGDQNNLFVNIVSIPTKKAGPASIGEDGSSAAGGRAKSANQPSNQHGTKAGPGSSKN